jgi:hypothetical protein
MSKIGTFDQNFVGLEVYPKGSSVNVRKSMSTNDPILFTKKAGELVGLTTGAYAKMSDGKWILIKSGTIQGYVREDVVNLVKPKTVTKDDSLTVIQKLVESDKAIYNSLQKIDILIQALKIQKKDTTASEKLLNNLATRLQTRQDDIKKSNVVKWTAGYNKVMNEAKEAVKKAYSGGDILNHIPIGNISGVPAIIIISVVAGGLLTAAAYFVFKPKYDESTADLKISKDLENLLAKTDPVTAKKITDNLEKQIDTAYNQGKTDGTFGGIFKTILPIAGLIAGYFLISSFVRTQSNKK